MKQTIKLTTTILAVAMVVGGSGAMKAMAQNSRRYRQRAQHGKIAAAEAGQPGDEQAGTGRSGTRGETRGHTGVEAGRGEGGGFRFVFLSPATSCSM